MNRADHAEVLRYLSSGDPDFFDEDFSDDVVDPTPLTAAEVAAIETAMALLPAEPAPFEPEQIGLD